MCFSVCSDEIPSRGGGFSSAARRRPSSGHCRDRPWPKAVTTTRRRSGTPNPKLVLLRRFRSPADLGPWGTTRPSIETTPHGADLGGVRSPTRLARGRACWGLIAEASGYVSKELDPSRLPRLIAKLPAARRLIRGARKQTARGERLVSASVDAPPGTAGSTVALERPCSELLQAGFRTLQGGLRRAGWYQLALRGDPVRPLAASSPHSMRAGFAVGERAPSGYAKNQGSNVGVPRTVEDCFATLMIFGGNRPRSKPGLGLGPGHGTGKRSSCGPRARHRTTTVARGPADRGGRMAGREGLRALPFTRGSISPWCRRRGDPEGAGRSRSAWVSPGRRQ